MHLNNGLGVSLFDQGIFIVEAQVSQILSAEVPGCVAELLNPPAKCNNETKEIQSRQIKPPNELTVKPKLESVFMSMWL